MSSLSLPLCLTLSFSRVYVPPLGKTSLVFFCLVEALSFSFAQPHLVSSFKALHSVSLWTAHVRGYLYVYARVQLRVCIHGLRDVSVSFHAEEELESTRFVSSRDGS